MSQKKSFLKNRNFYLLVLSIIAIFMAVYSNQRLSAIKQKQARVSAILEETKTKNEKLSKELEELKNTNSSLRNEGEELSAELEECNKNDVAMSDKFITVFSFFMGADDTTVKKEYFNDKSKFDKDLKKRMELASEYHMTEGNYSIHDGHVGINEVKVVTDNGKATQCYYLAQPNKYHTGYVYAEYGSLTGEYSDEYLQLMAHTVCMITPSVGSLVDAYHFLEELFVSANSEEVIIKSIDDINYGALVQGESMMLLIGRELS